jgi:hypothetical protein
VASHAACLLVTAEAAGAGSGSGSATDSEPDDEVGVESSVGLFNPFSGEEEDVDDNVRGRVGRVYCFVCL